MKKFVKRSLWSLLILFYIALFTLPFVIVYFLVREPKTERVEVLWVAETLVDKAFPAEGVVVWGEIDVPRSGGIISLPAMAGQKRYLRMEAEEVEELEEGDLTDTYKDNPFGNDVEQVVKDNLDLFSKNTGYASFSALLDGNVYAFVCWDELDEEKVNEFYDKRMKSCRGNNVGIYFIYDYETKEILYAQCIQMDNFCFQNVGIVLPENALPEGE